MPRSSDGRKPATVDPVMARKVLNLLKRTFDLSCGEDGVDFYLLCRKKKTVKRAGLEFTKPKRQTKWLTKPKYPVFDGTSSLLRLVE